MKLTKNKLFSGILLFGLTTILLALFDIQYFYLREIFSFIFLTTIPGLLIMLILKIRKIGFWEYLVYTIGLSIAFLMFAGLAVNWILPWMHITDKPLSLMPLLTGFYIILSIFGAIAYKRNRKISLKISLPKLSGINKVFFIAPVIFPVLSILGAIILNNGGPNYLTMVMLGGIAVYVFLVVLLRDKLSEHIFPWTILFISASLLLMYSLRSLHISGWDINEEFQMFQITKSAGYWSPTLIKHAYNSCLSLTILPTIISMFTNIIDENIYKVTYPLIFSFIPLSMYCLFRKLSTSIISFLAVFFFISQTWFIQPMAALARQEIAFLFFVLTLLMIFFNRINERTRNIMFLIFGFSMVVSHYSTTYVAISIFLILYILALIYRKTILNNRLRKVYSKTNLYSSRMKKSVYKIKIIPILLILSFTFLWNTQITDTAHNLSYVIENTIINMGSAFNDDLKSVDLQASLAIFSQPNDNTIENIRKYEKSELVIHNNIDNTYAYSINSAALLPIQDIEVNPIITTELNYLIFIIVAIVKLLTKLMLVIGPFLLFFTAFKKAIVDREFILLCMIGIGVILLMYILPVISQFYNLTRIYMQLLIFLSFPMVYGGFLLLRFVKNNLRVKILSTFFIIYFLFASGFVFQIFGGYAFLQLNNFGEDYDKFYTHQEEVNSAVWLSKNRNEKDLIFADEVSALRLYSFGNLGRVENTILSGIITKDSYVYLRYANVVRDRTDAHYKNKILVYKYPSEFLSINKNLIYNNGGSMIYK